MDSLTAQMRLESRNRRDHPRRTVRGRADDGRNYLDAANAPLAKNLRGKLLLIHGDTDDNVHPALTLQVVDALIKANKDFDMLIVPNADHGVMMGGYATRRQWDHFVRHLLGAEPPAGYRIGL